MQWIAALLLVGAAAGTAAMALATHHPKLAADAIPVQLQSEVKGGTQASRAADSEDTALIGWAISKDSTPPPGSVVRGYIYEPIVHHETDARRRRKGYAAS